MQRILFPATNIREYTNLSLTFSHEPSKYSTFFISSVCSTSYADEAFGKGFKKVSKPVHVDQT